MAYADGCYVGKRVKLELLSADEVRQIHAVHARRHRERRRHVPLAERPRRARGKRRHGRPRDDRRQDPRRGRREGAFHRAARSSRSAAALPSTTCRSTASTSTSPPTAAACSTATRSTAPCARRARRIWPTAPGSSRRSTTSRPPRPWSSAQDCPTQSRVLHEFDACVRNSAKHSIVVSIKEDWEARSLIRDGRGAGRRPRGAAQAADLHGHHLHRVSPLHQERFGMDLALTLAEAGIPISFYPMPILGATGRSRSPARQWSTTPSSSAAPRSCSSPIPARQVIHGGGPTAMYMNSGAYASNSPEAILMRSRPGPHGRLLRRAGLVRRRRHHRQGARHPERLRERHRHVHGLRQRRRRDLRHRPARRLAHPLPREHGGRRRDPRHGQAHPARRRGDATRRSPATSS